MDDLTLMATKVDETNTLLQRSSVALAWGRMSWRVKKSRCIIINNGDVSFHTPFSVHSSFKGKPSSEIIPSINGMPIKFLGRVIDSSLSDKEQVMKLEEKVKWGLNIIDKSGHYGVDKVWILQFLF